VPEAAADQAAIYQLAYVEGIRVLEDQARTLEQNRVRMMTLLGAGTATSALLVSVIFKVKPSDQDALYYMGVAAGALLFLGMLARCVQALRPKYTWHFNLSPKIIIDGYADHEVPASLAETHRALALILEQNIDHNEVNLSLFRKWLSQALALFLLDLLVWVSLAAKAALR
jgi:hypothetical protein